MADVLVVDDDSDIADVLAEIMMGEGHEVRVALDGEAGVREVHARAPDVILLDVDMPVLNGPGMAYVLLVHDAGLEKIPIVLLSGVPHLVAVARQVGTPYFLGKPYKYDALVALVDRALRERTPPVPGAQPST